MASTLQITGNLILKNGAKLFVKNEVMWDKKDIYDESSEDTIIDGTTVSCDYAYVGGSITMVDSDCDVIIQELPKN